MTEKISVVYLSVATEYLTDVGQVLNPRDEFVTNESFILSINAGLISKSASRIP